ncbi:hypothetical protein [Roseibium aggregatum]|uniref:Oxetanocin A resistance protein n=1 Tax=Roseibium aggregatum TaxID=187304 RepID=A0A939EEB3_9HYPH|nr:hypothetical protein [Roseibium aggregatum]MBN9670568.1 hypothetical protein [Roseibium aggregatum]
MTKTADELVLEPQCENCAALCCVVFVFDKSESFAIDKAAGEVCPNLDTCGKCTIFRERETLGFRGCIAYDCHGAGQRVTQEVFGGRSWRDDPILMNRMGDALSVLRQIHEQLLLLGAAAKLPLDPDERLELSGLRQILAPETDWSEESLKAFPVARATRQVADFLSRLRRHVQLSG